MAARVSGLLSKEKERRNRLKELEIDYDFPGFQGIVDSQSKGKTKSKSSAKQSEPAASPSSSRKNSAVKEEKEEPKKAEKKTRLGKGKK